MIKGVPRSIGAWLGMAIVVLIILYASVRIPFIAQFIWGVKKTS